MRYILFIGECVIEEHEGSGVDKQGGKCLGCQSDIVNTKDNSVWLTVAPISHPKVIHQILTCLIQQSLRLCLRRLEWRKDR